MSGRTPAGALEAYLEPYKTSIGCLTEPHFIVRLPRNSESETLSLRDSPKRLNRNVSVREGETSSLYFHMRQRIHIAEQTTARVSLRYQVVIDAWSYEIFDDEGQEILAFQWSRDELPKPPHVHVGSALLRGSAHPLAKGFSKLHIPTARLSIEEVIRFLITDLNVIPLREDWDAVLRAGQETFEQNRSSS